MLSLHHQQNSWNVIVKPEPAKHNLVQKPHVATTSDKLILKTVTANSTLIL